jgi:formylglycine-generating enzyme required for sulfatase activity
VNSGKSNKSTVIEPSGFTPLDTSNPGSNNQDSRQSLLQPRNLVIVSLLVSALVMGFLFTAKSVRIKAISDTVAELSVSGLAIPFGERYLMLPGTYQVSVRAEGYQALDTEVSISSQDNQTLELILQPLPGRLSVTSTPEDALVTINGEPIGNTPVSDHPLAPGSYQFILSHPRYQQHQQELQVTGRDVQQQLNMELSPAWANISLSSQPEGADIIIEGESHGKTPAQLELLQGEHQIGLQLQGYADWQQSLQVNAQQPIDLGTVKLLPAPGTVQLTTSPSGANVTLNGIFEGQTPVLLSLAPGQNHTLSVFRPGYRRHTESLSLSADENIERAVTLKPLLGSIKFSISPKNATLRINGRSQGQGSRVVSLPAVSHRIEVALEGYAPKRLNVTPRPGLEQLVTVALKTEKEARLERIKPTVTTALGQTLKLFDPAASTMADFTMGASRRDPGRRSNEVLRPVSLRRMFYMQTTEVSNAQFRQFQSDHKSGQVQGKSLNREGQPAVELSWQQAASFCNWLSRREGLPPFYVEENGIIKGFREAATGYRLPSEAEWAWAARSEGEKLKKFPWGDSFPPVEAIENYADKDSAFITGRVLNTYSDGYVVSAPTGSFKPNTLGLHDMGGNVAEWIHDVYSIPVGDGATSTDPLGAQSGDNYVIRGASWARAKLPELRLSYRDYGQAGRDDVGFRLARYAE